MVMIHLHVLVIKKFHRKFPKQNNCSVDEKKIIEKVKQNRLNYVVFNFNLSKNEEFFFNL
ncbi:hypothetical protein BpHYR1_040923 [Brachionus plicatilis]|uniref:Uncharacterized protein n=1 Tax=Brachionus plicatilis TaxID=10195 RepID=A0A3M7SHB2_BRAPC|nr:hypothetical protein BpHYR1_040923 [Brachionus plicatilis]